MITPLDRIKSHLNIDKHFTDDDELLIFYAQVAEDAIEKHINCPLSRLMGYDGYVPSSIQSAILLLVGNLYQNREPVSMGTINKIPYTFDYLVNLNKNYKNIF